MQVDALKFSENYKSYFAKGLSGKFIYFTSGEEIYFLNKTSDILLQVAENENFSQKVTFYITNSSNWDEIFSEITQQGLFAANKVIVLHFELKKIDKKIVENLNKLTSELSNLELQGRQNNLVLITYPSKLEAKFQKDAWYNYIKNKGFIISSGILYQNQFNAYLKNYSLKLNLRFSKDCLDYLCVKNQGNLFAATQEVEKLKLIAAENDRLIDLEYLSKILANNGLYSVFDLANNLLKGDYLESTKLFRLLVEQGVQIVLILWLIAKELRDLAIIINDSKVAKINLHQFVNQKIKWASKKSNTIVALNRLSIDKINIILDRVSKIDHYLKSYSSPNYINHKVEKLIYNICSNELKGEN